MANEQVDELADAVAAGDRRALARAITLVESRHPDHRSDAAALLDRLLPRTGAAERVGISGPPGAGKSTFIEALGLQLAEAERRVAVLAIDPSSARTHGSILGDKTRMDQLAKHPLAYIRPSPSGGALGGVGERTRASILVCEAAGFDVVLVETVGVGQSEVEVDDLVDTFVLLLAPGAGDELQGMKRGIMELADVVVVTKADGDMLGPAQHAAAEYRRALHLLRPKHAGWTVEVLLASALTGTGVDEVWDAVARHRTALAADGALAERRAEQLRRWLWDEVRQQLLARVRDDDDLRRRIGDVEAAVARGDRSAPSAAAQVLEALR